MLGQRADHATDQCLQSILSFDRLQASQCFNRLLWTILGRHKDNRSRIFGGQEIARGW